MTGREKLTNERLKKIAKMRSEGFLVSCRVSEWEIESIAQELLSLRRYVRDYEDKSMMRLSEENRLLKEGGEKLAKLVKPRAHYYCEDSWYSCPRAEEGCADSSQGDECNCGADDYNKEIEEVLQQHEELRKDD